MTMNLANSLLEESVLGKGLKSPLEEDSDTGDFARVAGADNVMACIIDLIETRIGERVMNEDAGTELPDQLFEEPGAVIDIAPRRIVEAIRRYEPRVKNVKVHAEQIEDTKVEITVEWTLRSTGLPGSLVYPFYTEPPAGGVSNT